MGVHAKLTVENLVLHRAIRASAFRPKTSPPIDGPRTSGAVRLFPVDGRLDPANPKMPMKAPWIVLKTVLASVVLAGCATTDHELSQKEKDRLAREQARADQKQAQAQQKMMQNASQGTSRKGSR